MVRRKTGTRRYDAHGAYGSRYILAL